VQKHSHSSSLQDCSDGRWDGINGGQNCNPQSTICSRIRQENAPPRPLPIQLGNCMAKSLVMKSAYKLSTAPARFHNVIVAHNLTKKKLKCKELVEEAKEVYCGIRHSFTMISSMRIIITDHIYMEKGHSQMECDSVHSTIERSFKHQNAWVSEWVSSFLTALQHNTGYIVPYR